MSRVWAIFKKEFSGYFNSLMAYFFLVVLLGISGLMFTLLVLLRERNADLNQYFMFLEMGIWLFVPAVTMRMWSEEKKLGTLELIMTMPVRDGEAVLGKFLASFAFFFVTLLLSFLTIPTIVSFYGNLDWGAVVGGYLGMLLLGSSFIAIGLALSAMTENQFIAFIVSSIICVALLGVAELLQWVPLPGPVISIVNWIDAGTHFQSISRGVIDTRDLVYYFSIIGFFLFLNYRSVTSRRWK